MIFHSIGESEEVLDVESFVVQMLYWILDCDIPLSGMSVHGGQGAEYVDYRIHVMSRRLILSDSMNLEWSCNHF